MATMPTRENLATVQALYRAPDSLTLYGIPYRLREGQFPRDIAEKYRGDWIYLGEPGWFYGTQAQQQLVEQWLQPYEQAGIVPGGPHEWTYLDDDYEDCMRPQTNPQSGPFTSVPSAKKLESDLGLDRAAAKKLHAVLKGDDDAIDDVLGPSNVLTYQSGRAPARSLAMQAADRLLDNHGIEAQRNEDEDADWDDAPDFLYSNTGDSYAPTLLFRGGRVWISSWGDEMEARERRRNPAEQSDTRQAAIASRLANP